MTFKLRFLFFLSIVLCKFVWSQESTVNYNFVNINKEMPKVVVSSILQDEEGFVWIGTIGFGIYRFDGLNFKSYKNHVNDSTSVNNLKIEDSLAKMQTTFSEYQALASEMRILLSKPDTQNLPGDFNRNLEKITKSMAQFEITMRQFDKTMASYQAGSQMHHQLEQTLLQIKRLSEEFQPLTRGLNEQPNMLIFDKSLPSDPQPRKQ